MIVNYKRSGVHNADGIILKPGNNSVNIKDWEKVRKHPTIKAAIEDGEIVEESEFDTSVTEEQDKAGEETILSAMKIPQAKQMVEETVDVELLERWKKGEKRNQVIGAINTQIEKLKAPAEQRDRSQSRQQSIGVDVKETVVRNPEDN